MANETTDTADTDTKEPTLPGIATGSVEKAMAKEPAPPMPGGPAPAAPAIAPPKLPAGAAKAKAEPELTDDVMRTALAKLGLGSADEIEALRAAARELEKFKPDEKAKRELAAARESAKAAQAERDQIKGELTQLRTAEAERTRAQQVADWERFVGDISRAVVRQARIHDEGPYGDDLAMLIQSKMRVVGDGETRRVRFQEGPTTFESSPNGFTDEDIQRLVRTLSEHVVKTRPAWIKPQTPTTAGAMLSGVRSPFAAGTPGTAPAGHNDVASFLASIPVRGGTAPH